MDLSLFAEAKRAGIVACCEEEAGDEDGGGGDDRISEVECESFRFCGGFGFKADGGCWDVSDTDLADEGPVSGM